MNPAPIISVVIVNYKSTDFLKRCLASLESRMKVAHEICVVDNASEDDCAQYLKKNRPDIKVIANSRNLGFAAAVNQGIRASSAPFILWLNPDTEFLEGNMEDAIQWMEKNPSLGILGLQILNPDRSIQLSCRSFPSYGTAFFSRYSLLTKWFPKNIFSRRYLKTDCDHGAVQEADWVSGACLLHRRPVAGEIGFVDEGYFMYCEDVDFCRRAQEAGWKTAYYPGVKFSHHIAGSSRRTPLKMILARHRSMWRYYTKFYRRNFLKDTAVAAGIFLRGFFQASCFILSRKKEAE